MRRLVIASSTIIGLSCCCNSTDVTIRAGALVVEAGNNKPSDGIQFLSMSTASSDCQASVPATPMSTANE